MARSEFGLSSLVDRPVVSEIPVFVEFVPLNKNGSYIFKSGSRYYLTYECQQNSTTINCICKKRFLSKCKFRVTLQMVNIFDRSLAGFYQKNNLKVKIRKKFEIHTCDGFSSINQAREDAFKSTKILGKF